MTFHLCKTAFGLAGGWFFTQDLWFAKEKYAVVVRHI